MKILRFDLVAYGSFTGCTLDLSGGREGLHIIYGPNEAGKSTALRALHGLLYGFPHSTSDAHLHQASDLRVGGLLRAADGRLLECVRRKGKKDTLRSGDESQVIDTRELAGMLGEVDAEAFRHRFGISHAALVEGGRAIAEGAGDLGQSLFAAAAGTASLARVRKELTAAAGELFKPSGSLPRVNKALRELKEQQQCVKAAQVPLTDWEARTAACEQAQAELARIEKQLIEHEAEKRRLEQFSQALPDVALRQDLIRELDPFASSPRLPATFADRQRTAREQHSRAEVLERLAREEQDRVAGELASLPAAFPLLAHRKEIEQLNKLLGSVEKARVDRPQLTERQRALESECQRLWQELDPALVSSATSQRLKTAERARLNELVAEHPRLAAELASAEKARDTLAREIEALEERLRAVPAAPDSHALRSAVRTAEALAPAEGEAAQAERNLASLARKLQQALTQLGWSGTAAELLSRSLPSRETIEQFRTRLDAAATEIKGLRQELERIDRERREGENRAEQLRITHDAPTEEDVTAARAARDEGWQLVLASWRKELPSKVAAERFVAAFPPAAELAQAYELAVQRADDLGDRLRRETAQVALKCELRAQLLALAAERERVEKTLAAAQTAAERAEAEWIAVWQPVGIVPRSPAEMRAWRDKADEVASLASAEADQVAEQEQLAAKVAQARRGLIEALEKPGTAAPAKAPLAALIDLAAAKLAELEEQSKRHETLSRDVRLRRDKLPALEVAQQQAAAAVDNWRTEWTKALGPLSLAAGASPAEARAVLTLVDEIQAKQREGAGLAERIAGIDHDAHEFATRVTAAVQAVASDLKGLLVDAAVEALSQRLVVETNAAAQREELAKAQRIAAGKCRAAREAVLLAAQDLESLCREAGCQSAAELPAAAEQAEQRAMLEAKLTETEGRLRRCAAGEPLDAFVSAAAVQHDGDLKASLSRVNEMLRELSLERDVARDTLRDARAELAKIDGSARAAEAQAAAEKAAADVCAGAEEYCRLQLAGAVLAKAVERFRKNNEGELLTRASELFQELTRGSFQGLRADYGEAGEPILVGLRNDLKTVGVEAMSEGTRDQLYLALRLASVETHCKTAGLEPLPLVIDDVLIQFDDDRSAAALRAFARLAEHTQVVFFTHHEHLLELARDTLDDDILFIQRLDGQASGMPLEANAGRVEER